MKILKIEVEGVRWDADDMGDVADIPTEVTICIEVEDEDIEDVEAIEQELEDELSNEFGFTHEGWNTYKVIG